MKIARKGWLAAALGASALVVGAPGASAVLAVGPTASESCAPDSGPVTPGSSWSCSLQTTNGDTTSHNVYVSQAFYERGALVNGGSWNIAMKPGATYQSSITSEFGGGTQHGASVFQRVGYDGFPTAIVRGTHSYTVATGAGTTPAAGSPTATETCSPNGGSVTPGTPWTCHIHISNSDSASHTFYISQAQYERGTLVNGGSWSIELKPGAQFDTDISSSFDGGTQHGASAFQRVGYDNVSTPLVRNTHMYTVAGGGGTPI